MKFLWVFVVSTIVFFVAFALAECHGEECLAVDLLQKRLSLQNDLRRVGQSEGFPEETGRAGSQIQYGKYYRLNDGSFEDNSIYVHWLGEAKPVNAPVVIEFHAGAFVSMWPITTSNTVTDLFNRNGFVFISVGYRLFPNRYLYVDEHGVEQLEEFVNIGEDLTLSLDTTGRTYTDFKPHLGYTEVIPKPFYDASRALDYIIDHADELGIDPHNMVFQGGSSGAGISNYLAYLYHSAHSDRFTVKTLLLESAQLDYPVEPMQDHAWSIFAATMGESASLTHIIDDESCPHIIGSAACIDVVAIADAEPAFFQYEYCNMTWHAQRMETYCNAQSSWKDFTVGDMVSSTVWPDYPKGSYDKSLEGLWYITHAMKKFPNSDVAVFLGSYLNGTDPMSVPHHPSFAVAYGELAHELGIQYVVYYTDFQGMADRHRTPVRFTGDHEGLRSEWNYKSNLDWRSQPEAGAHVPVSSEEQLMFCCWHMGLSCDPTLS
eukprot:CAMPEP_0197644386 /NCGR_PEP_ID=MMETSP1338-20131121/17377_1 /TAXON_ID=43686 ORGANISM="Pelagodinium beii, Strain RCC1491" /NCGR_SAMPLE_ID=MMETSP1338 /ASSEMBLY_ACC=CAM_ASM_000754 /LENGTH=488 /DNA_ID=CAMNT_0043217777 /DNA_START=81 /DNA_END=1547 /DNA_ORIENTATION=-